MSSSSSSAVPSSTRSRPISSKHRHGERRDAVEAAVLDAALGAAQQLAQAAQVGKLVGGVLAGGAQQDVAGLVDAQRVVDQV